jgi:hypothetical protein
MARFQEGDRFTARELIDLEGARVVARSGGLAAAGSMGTIIASRCLEGAWVLVVEWDDHHQEVFSKRDAVALLRLQDHC